MHENQVTAGAEEADPGPRITYNKEAFSAGAEASRGGQPRQCPETSSAWSTADWYDGLRTVSAGRRSLPVRLTPDEQSDMRERVGIHLRHAGAIERRMNDAKALAADLKKSYDAKLIEARGLSAVADSGEESRMVDTVVVVDAAGLTKYYVRLDQDVDFVYKTVLIESGSQGDLDLGKEGVSKGVLAAINRRLGAKPEAIPERPLAELLKSSIVDSGGQVGMTFIAAISPFSSGEDEEEPAEQTLWALIHLGEVECVESDVDGIRVVRTDFPVPIHDIAAMLAIANDQDDDRNTGLGTPGGPAEDVEMEVIFAPVDFAEAVRDHVTRDGTGDTVGETVAFLDLPAPSIAGTAADWCRAAGWIDVFALHDAPDLERLWPPVATTEGEALGAMYEIITGEKPGKKKDATLRAAILGQRVTVRDSP